MAPDTLPNWDDWNFADIERHQRHRAVLLMAAGNADDLSFAILDAFRSAITDDQLRFAVDCDQGRPRVILQFPVANSLYDWFFNARTGYRAEFWARAERGHEYNKQLVIRMSVLLWKSLPASIIARKIFTRFIGGGSREDTDTGSTIIHRDTIIRSLDPELSKLWVCERLIQVDGSNPRNTRAIENAQRYPPKLIVPRWAQAKHPKTGDVGEGLRAPYPDLPECWLDLKGAFVAPDTVYQLKSPKERAVSLHERGWT